MHGETADHRLDELGGFPRLWNRRYLDDLLEKRYTPSFQTDSKLITINSKPQAPLPLRALRQTLRREGPAPQVREGEGSSKRLAAQQRLTFTFRFTGPFLSRKGRGAARDR